MQRVTREMCNLQIGTKQTKRRGQQQQPRARAPRRRNRRRNEQQGYQPFVVGAPTRPRMRIAGQRNREGEVTLSKREMMCDIAVKKDAGQASIVKYLYPDTSADQMPWLSKLAKNFDRFKFHKIHIFYKPAVSAMTAGRVSVGVDWNQSIGTATAEAVTNCSPSMQFPVWEDTEGRPIVLPKNRLQSVQWYRVGSGTGTDKGPGNLVAYVATTTVTADTTIGSLWIDYTITLQGTNSV